MRTIRAGTGHHLVYIRDHVDGHSLAGSLRKGDEAISIAITQN